MEQDAFVDLHAHASIPILGALWRRAQGSRLPVLDRGAPPDSGPARLNLIALYETFFLRRGAARARVLAAARAWGDRLAAASGDATSVQATSPGAASTRAATEAAILVTRAADLDRGYHQGYLLAVESLRHIADPSDLRVLWDLGVRSLQPIHFLDTGWGRSSLEGLWRPSRKGLSGLGREMLAEMDRLGFILDLAHMNDPTAEGSLALYKGPIICSHTGLREIRNSPRNIPAELAREVFRRGGAVGVTCWLRLLGPLRKTSRGGGFRGGPPGASGGHGPGRSPRADKPDGFRAAWTRSFCETASAMAALAPGARVCVGSDRGAPIRVPSWVFSADHLAEVAAELETRGWNADARRGFRWKNAREFLQGALPP